MLTIFTQTLMPIFVIIALGYYLKTRKLLNREINGPINKLVYYVAIPAMLVVKLSQMSLARSFQPKIFLSVMAALPLVWLLARFVAGRFVDGAGRRATFIQSCYHGNLGYMGYAVVFYALGEPAFTQAAVLGGFMMIEQNLLTVLAFTLEHNLSQERPILRTALRPIVANPVILSVLAGLVLSLGSLNLPLPLFRTLNILAGMSFPLALLLIGAGLSFGRVRLVGRELFGTGLFKLVLLPLTGYLILLALGVPRTSLLPPLILLASPPATVTYVYATGMNGDPDLAAAGISLHTLLCAFAYSFLFYRFMI